MHSDHDIWYPFSNLKSEPEPLTVTKGEGVYLTLEDGQTVIDGISSWWVNLFGHSHPDISKAIREQSDQLEHVIFAGFTHEPAKKLAKTLKTMMPHTDKVFFTDDGSTSVELAIKTALQYWFNQGESRTKILAFEGAYHGDTFGAMSAAERSAFNKPFHDLLFEVDSVPYPSTFDHDSERTEKEAHSLQIIKKKFETELPAAVILEPLVQGAGGMRMCSERFLQELEQLCKEYDVLTIYDEVMTGFGRTGANFAHQRAGTKPDLICLSKGITGGFLPLAVTMSTRKVFEVFYDDDPYKALYHGHSYTANPLGCAAANASMTLLEENQGNIKRLEEWHLSLADQYLDYDNVCRKRVMGTIIAFDLDNKEQTGYFNSIAKQFRAFALKKGCLLRPLGNTIYIMPPYVITHGQLERLYQCISDFIKSVQ